MNRRMKSWRFFVAMMALGGWLSAGADASPIFGGVMENLVRDGYDPGWVVRLYGDSRAEFLSPIAQINIKHEEDTAAYRSFLEEKNLGIARDYLRRHGATLRRFSDQTAVPPEIVVAILLIETKCGAHSSKAPVLNVLSTIASCAEDGQVEKSYETLKAQYPNLTKADIRRRARARSRWAYKELRAFIDWVAADPPEDVYSIQGSWAGALGLPQFMPSSITVFGADGDGDGRIDLYNDTDAIASVCKYLRKNGWKSGRAAHAQRGVIWKYNHSPLYVETVLNVADRISR